MRIQDFPSATAIRFRRPSTWGAILVFGLVWVMVRLLAGQPFGRFGMGEFLMPVLLLAGHLALSPIPWQWTGDERRMAPLWRGCLQALPWNAAWLAALLFLLRGLLPPPPAQRPHEPALIHPVHAVLLPKDESLQMLPLLVGESLPSVALLQAESPQDPPKLQDRDRRPPPRPGERRPDGQPPRDDRERRNDGPRPREDRERRPPSEDGERRPDGPPPRREEERRELPGLRKNPPQASPVQEERPAPQESSPAKEVPKPADADAKPSQGRTAGDAPEARERPTGILALMPMSHRPEFMLMFILVLLNLPFAMILGWFMAEKERAESTEEELVELARQAQAKALQAQLHPHALYNVLGGLTELVHEDPDAAEEAIVGLVEMLRMLTRQSAASELPLSQERALVKHYLAIEEIRLGPRLQVKWQWPEWADAIKLPPLLLQPLVENAIKHGISPHPEGGTLLIGVFKTSRDIVLRVANTGQPFEASSAEGTGLRNLRERLALMPKMDASLELRWDDGWTLAELRLRNTLGACNP